MNRNPRMRVVEIAPGVAELVIGDDVGGHMGEHRARSSHRLGGQARRQVVEAIKAWHTWSDREIADRLSDQYGIRVSRSTVNRMRHEMVRAERGAIPWRSRYPLRSPLPGQCRCGRGLLESEVLLSPPLCQYCRERREARLCMRARRVLQENKINSERRLRRLWPDDLLKLKGMGPELIRFIEKAISTRGNNYMEQLFPKPKARLNCEPEGDLPHQESARDRGSSKATGAELKGRSGKSPRRRRVTDG